MTTWSLLKEGSLEAVSTVRNWRNQGSLMNCDSSGRKPADAITNLNRMIRQCTLTREATTVMAQLKSSIDSPNLRHMTVMVLTKQVPTITSTSLDHMTLMLLSTWDPSINSS